MSRYFRFKSQAELAAAARTLLGEDLPLTSDWSALRQPVRVGDRVIGNRLAIQPMEGCDGTTDGHPTDLTWRRYQRFGAGGAKLVWGEAAAVLDEGRANPRQLIAGDAQRDGLAWMVEQCRMEHRRAWGDDSDLLVGLQLTHSGRYSVPRAMLAQHDPLLDPRTVADRATGRLVAADEPLITDAALERLQDAYVQAARVAQRAGFDFIDLKQCHRYLLNELLAAHTRPGPYGGPYEHRTRFIRELAARLRSELPDLMLATRLNVYDGVPYRRCAETDKGIAEIQPGAAASTWGTDRCDPTRPDLTEPLRLIGELEAMGVRLVNVSLGNPYASPHLLRPYDYSPVDGYAPPEHPLLGVWRHLRLTAQVQRTYPDLAVVGSGYSWLQRFIPDVGAALVARGEVTFVGVGRGALAQPDFGRAILAGEPLDPRRTCRTFSYCTALMRNKKHPLGQYPTGCPPFDKEVYGPIWTEAREGSADKPG